MRHFQAFYKTDFFLLCHIYIIRFVFESKPRLSVGGYIQNLVKPVVLYKDVMSFMFNPSVRCDYRHTRLKIPPSLLLSPKFVI